ncbi:MAG: hypothetical protein H6977_16010 [Gammaproteobacteria bacterium]|nr:hypothetical protein [Gammaproteobacteria bacterium]MCP5201508.1 hypothetical protein [Gammaproteobacteria bacterium]
MRRTAARLLLAAGLAATLLLGFGLYYHHAINPAVIEEIRRAPDGPRARETLVLTLPGGRVIPVNYLYEGGRVFVGADGRWWRSLGTGGAPVTLLVRGRRLVGTARAVDDAPLRDAVFARLRPTEPDWLPGWARGKLVVIELAGDAAVPSR